MAQDFLYETGKLFVKQGGTYDKAVSYTHLDVYKRQLLNIKTVAERRENMLWFRTPEKVYFKKGCLPVALKELKDVMGKKRACLLYTSRCV